MVKLSGGEALAKSLAREGWADTVLSGCYKARRNPLATRAFPKLLNTAEGGLMAWLGGWMGDSSWGRNPGSGAGMTRVTLL